jgi:hypothetical protein
MTTLAPPLSQAYLAGKLADSGWPAIEPQPASATGAAVPGECVLAGFAFAESTGAASATVDLFDGGGTGGQFICRVNLVASESVRESLPFPGVHCEVGLFVNVVAGTVLGSVWAIVI